MTWCFVDLLFPLPRFNRQIDAALERHIEEVWTERVSKEPWLFNGAKFRLHSFCLASPQCPSLSCDSSKPPPCPHSSFVTSLDFVEDQEDKSQSRPRPQGLCDSDPLCDVTQNSLDQTSRSVNHTENVEGVIQQTTNSLDQDCSTCRKAELPPHAGKNTDDRDTGPLLTLSLGLTCYKDYLGTNWSCRVEELRQRGGAEFSDPLALLAQPLGVGAVLCTGDRQVVLIRRSQRVAEAGGLLDIPGGHPEPQVRWNDKWMHITNVPEALIALVLLCAGGVWASGPDSGGWGQSGHDAAEARGRRLWAVCVSLRWDQRWSEFVLRRHNNLLLTWYFIQQRVISSYGHDRETHIIK